MVGIYADCNLPDRSFRARAEKVIDISFNRLIDAIRVVPQVKQFELRIAKRPGLPSEIASALWQKGVHIQAFSAQLQRTEAALLIDLREAAQIVYERFGRIRPLPTRLGHTRVPRKLCSTNCASVLASCSPQ